jgi:hypothetical protein
MRRRVTQTATIDMIPMMGLCTVLIPLVLLASVPAISVIDTGLPSI